MLLNPLILDKENAALADDRGVHNLVSRLNQIETENLVQTKNQTKNSINRTELKIKIFLVLDPTYFYATSIDVGLLFLYFSCHSHLLGKIKMLIPSPSSRGNGIRAWGCKFAHLERPHVSLGLTLSCTS